MKKILYFLSKTDTSVIGFCPPITRDIQASLGFFVALTGTLAFISGTYAISNMFMTEDVLTHRPVISDLGWIFSILLGMVYATFIMAIDREIVSASNKMAVFLRLPLAVIISLIVSVPMEMKLFDARLVKQLNADNKEENKGLTDTLASNVQKVRIRFRALETERATAVIQRDHWAKVMQNEIVGVKGDNQLTGRAGKGPAYDQADANRKAQQDIIDHDDIEMKATGIILEKAMNDQDSKFEIKRQVQSFDLLSKYIALGEIKSGDRTGSAGLMSWGITLLFFLFEAIPCIMKLMLPKTEYDTLIEKRRLLNILSANMIYEDAISEYYNKTAKDLMEENPLRVEEMLLSQSR